MTDPKWHVQGLLSNAICMPLEPFPWHALQHSLQLALACPSLQPLKLACSSIAFHMPLKTLSSIALRMPFKTLSSITLCMPSKTLSSVALCMTSLALPLACLVRYCQALSSIASVCVISSDLLLSHVQVCAG